MEVYYTFKEGGKSYSDESSCLAQRCWKSVALSQKLNENQNETAEGKRGVKVQYAAGLVSFWQ